MQDVEVEVEVEVEVVVSIGGGSAGELDVDGAGGGELVVEIGERGAHRQARLSAASAVVKSLGEATSGVGGVGGRGPRTPSAREVPVGDRVTAARPAGATSGAIHQAIATTKIRTATAAATVRGVTQRRHWAGGGACLAIVGHRLVGPAAPRRGHRGACLGLGVHLDQPLPGLLSHGLPQRLLAGSKGQLVDLVTEGAQT